MSYSKKNRFLGLPLMQGGISDLHAALSKAVNAEKPSVIAHLNLHALYLSRKHAWLQPFFNQADFVYCDGEAVRWAAKSLDLEVPEKIGLTRWIWTLAGLCEREHWRIFLLGGAEGIAQAAAQKLKDAYPGLEIAGTHHGYFDRSGDSNFKAVELIQKSRADIVIVSLGMPAQEAWIRDNLRSFSKGVFFPGGGVLDYVAGRLGKAPPWMIDWHLEWLFRIYQEPERLLRRYLIEIPWFFFTVLREKLRSL